MAERRKINRSVHVMKKYVFEEINVTTRIKKIGYGKTVKSAFRDMQERNGIIDPEPWKKRSNYYWDYNVED